MILTIRTDNTEAALGLFEADRQIAYQTWQAHRQLAETIHKTLKTLLDGQQKSLQDITGIVVYKGPGSFTGLRIGISVANALAYSLDVPVAAGTGEDWIAQAIAVLHTHPANRTVTPEYGSPAHITLPKK